MRRGSPQFVYFLREVGKAGPVKIGCTIDLDRRLVDYLRWSPVDLEVVASLPGDYLLERRFHARFRHLHRRNEWFSPSPEIDAVISAIRRGTFDPGTLPAKGFWLGKRNTGPRNWSAEQRAAHGDAVRRGWAWSRRDRGRVGANPVKEGEAA